MNMSHTWEHNVDGPSWLPVERILWAPTNSAHGNHLHVVGLPRMGQDELPTNGVWTPAIGEIVDALDAEFGAGEHFIIDPDAPWTHMGVFNPRYIGGTTTWSQHAGANAIDIGPYYGVEEQQVFYDFLTIKEDNAMAFTAHEEDELKRIIQALDEVGSNGSFAKYTVEHLRNPPEGSGTDSHARSLAKQALEKLASIKNAI